MNRSLKWMQRVTLVTLAAGVLCTAVIARPMQNAEESGASKLSQLADQINIMRVLITKSINEGPFAERYNEAATAAASARAKKALDAQAESEQAMNTDDAQLAIARLQGLVYSSTQGRTSFTSHTRGFYADGVGVLFSTEVRVPVRQIQVEPQEDESGSDEVNEWDEAAAEARGTNRIRGLVSGTRSHDDAPKTSWVIDQSYVDDAIAGVTEKIARFGSNVSALPNTESFIVALRCEPDGSSSSWPTLMDSQNEGNAALTYSNLATVNWRGSGSAATWHVVVQIPMSLVQNYDSGAITLEQLRDGTTVTQITQKSENSWYSVGSGRSLWSEPAIAPILPSPPPAPSGGVGRVRSGSGTGR